MSSSEPDRPAPPRPPTPEPSPNGGDGESEITNSWPCRIAACGSVSLTTFGIQA
ncbi:hypothetical protein CONLIGDRAFT_630457 [Coniochaeta ligniaria NRRL 30616]|uniref:Uncharacterized protein n=1 Tax=Coniochaeta ligniaria NRRL 30616 TaxID=1408157 RepID=A0A1J7JKV2_9PEZI|nr:hypothetical protein CONLIGDRAFT_630457 [Coniochaeta ligniaria NRRL 30616]